eukprot:gb/GFBE01046525.1/.p1 GENE.gb/GFBE01046525.1/~~gb/GFBE01046525.1/.p1  ORF type:complete len:216 (+),score=17.77 gb/GFBE01046525.1/:1-648(+)
MGCCESCQHPESPDALTSPRMAEPGGVSAGPGELGRQPTRPSSGPDKPVSQPRQPRPSPPPVVPIAPRRISPELVRLQYRELSPDDYELLCLLDEAVPNRSTTPHSIIPQLQSMPASDAEATECRICLAKVGPRSPVVRLPCAHSFHPDCVSKWLTQCKGTCPVCLQPVGDYLQDASEQAVVQAAKASQNPIWGNLLDLEQEPHVGQEGLTRLTV